jgi:replication factor C large subunit
MSMLWTDKYFPRTENEFVGNSEVLDSALQWAKLWNSGERMPPLLLWGHTGTGKTCLAYLIAKKFGWSILELNSSDLRSKDVIERVVGAASQNSSFSGSKRLILIDEIDAMASVDRGGVGAVASLIKNSFNPIILTANDIFSEKSVSQLRFICKALEFKKINYVSIAKKLREILVGEKIPFDNEAVEELAKNSGGDMRSALLDLQSVSFSGKVSIDAVKLVASRERQQKVFEVMKSIFRGKLFADAREARLRSDLSPDMLFNWVDENIPRQYKNHVDVANAFDILSRSDIFNGRIYRRQHWGFLAYSTELAAEGVCLSKSVPNFDFVVYQFPSLLSTLSKSSPLRSLKKELGKKIGSKMHSSSKEVVKSDLPFLKDIFSKRENAVSLSAVFDLDENEIGFLLGKGPETKVVQSIFADAQELKAKLSKPKFFSNSFGFGDNESLDSDSSLKEKHSEDMSKQTKLF